MLAVSVSISFFIVYRQFRNDIKLAEASVFPPDNVSGWAWNEKYGWISFNSTDCDADCPGPVGTNCVSDGALVGCPAAGTLYPDYGVAIHRVTGAFSGYAWSSNLGWISFNRIDTGDPASDDPGGGSGEIAKLDMVTSSDTYRKIIGWAKVLSLGDDGWIRFDDNDTGDAYDFGVSVPDLPADGIFSGWAYSSSTASDLYGIGWISFNCSFCDAASDNSGEACSVSADCPNGVCVYNCDSSDYKVEVDESTLNRPPTVSFGAMDHPGYCNDDPSCFEGQCACAESVCVTNPQIKWNFNDEDPGDSQGQYQIFFHKDNWNETQIKAFSDPGTGAALPLKTSVFNGTAGSFYPANNGYRNATIDYGEDYYYWVKVWDDKGGESYWTKFNDPSDADGDGNPETFTTYKNEFPDPYFIWQPRSFSSGQEVKFTDQSDYYIGGDNYDCDDDNCRIEWEFSEGVDVINASTTIKTFNDIGNFSATSTVMQKITTYSCSTTTKAYTNIGLFKWIESR